MPFTGQANATIDDKTRLAIPLKFRNRWDPANDGPTWFCVPWVQTRSLHLYTHAMYNELFALGRTAPSLTPSPDRAELERTLHAATEEVDIDKTHRIRIPAWQAEALSLPRDVVVLGAGDRLEIHPRDQWEATFNNKLSVMHELAQKLQGATP